MDPRLPRLHGMYKPQHVVHPLYGIEILNVHITGYLCTPPRRRATEAYAAQDVPRRRACDVVPHSPIRGGQAAVKSGLPGLRR